MITPNKFMKLEDCTLKLSSEIIVLLLNKKGKKIKYEELYQKFYQKYLEDTEYFFIPALNFLYLLGKLEYDIKKDELRLLS